MIELRSELNAIAQQYQSYESSVLGFLDATMTGQGFNPDARDDFSRPSFDSVPGVTMPAPTGNVNFDPSHDPYDAYATKMLTTLRGRVVNGVVIDRAGYLAQVREWRRNQEALDRSLKELLNKGAVSQAEWGAYLAARNRVTNELLLYLIPGDWFKDCPVPARLRELVDGVLARRDPEQATALKEALNEWHDGQLTPQEELLTDTVTGVIAGMDGLTEDDLDDQGHVKAALAGATALAKTALAIGVGFTPWGDFVDACEATTGYEFCNFSGRKLEISERVAAGAGFVIGSGAFWKLAGGVVGAAPAVIFFKVGNLLESLSDITVAERKVLLGKLGHTLPELYDISGKEVQRLVATLDEAALHQLAPKLKGKGLVELSAMKMFTSPAAGATLPGYKFTGAAKAYLDDVRNGAMARQFPSFRNRPFAELNAQFWENPTKLRNGWKNPLNTADQIIYTHADGTVVRIAPNGTTARKDRPHYKVEISKTAHAYAPSDIVCKVTDTHAIVPAIPDPDRPRPCRCQVPRIWRFGFERSLERLRARQNAIPSSPYGPTRLTSIT